MTQNGTMEPHDLDAFFGYREWERSEPVVVVAPTSPREEKDEVLEAAFGPAVLFCWLNEPMEEGERRKRAEYFARTGATCGAWWYISEEIRIRTLAQMVEAGDVSEDCLSDEDYKLVWEEIRQK